MQWRNSDRHFGTIATAFHWLIVAGLIAQYFLAEAAEDNEGRVGTAFDPMNLHQSIGWTILLLAVLRLTWRLIDSHPRWPATMKRHELVLAKLAHASFYVLLFALPLSGWALSSADSEQLRFFDLVAIPALPAQESMKETLEEVHEVLFNVLLALSVLHIVAALKHHFIDHDRVLRSMLPGSR
jgi:cytochrome b561